jgi:hypothetical protein
VGDERGKWGMREEAQQGLISWSKDLGFILNSKQLLRIVAGSHLSFWKTAL